MSAVAAARSHSAAIPIIWSTGGARLDTRVLTIGFGRRFATYKRANLILHESVRLAESINDPIMPIQLVFTGKAHPHDQPGKMVLWKLRLSRDPLLYRSARLCRRLRYEHGAPPGPGSRCVAQYPPTADGGIGHQWTEGRAQRRSEPIGARWLVGRGLPRRDGFAIGRGERIVRPKGRSMRDAADLYRTLTEEVIPTFYNRDQDGLPHHDPPHETGHSYTGLAFQRQPYGDGLHAAAVLTRPAVCRATCHRGEISPNVGARKTMTRRRIGVLTSGGDCPGLNAVIRGASKRAQLGYDCVGFLKGYEGLDRARDLRSAEQQKHRRHSQPRRHDSGLDQQGPLRRQGAVVIGSKSTWSFPGRRAVTVEQLDLSGLICVGGDGSLAVAQQFHEFGIPVVGVPKTIDNDLSATAYTFGFDCAVASPPTRSTGCTLRPRRTNGSWSSKSWAGTPAGSPCTRALPAAAT